MKELQNSAPVILCFGLTDCVSLTPFIKQGLRPVKTAAHSLVPRIAKAPVKDALDFPEDAIAVVGASCRLPGANNLEELWETLASGTDRHRSLDNDRTDLYGSFRASQSGNFTKERNFIGNFIDDVQRFDNSFFGVNPREAASMDPQQRILLEVAYEALDDAGYLATHHREDGDNVGCFIGRSLVEYNTNSLQQLTPLPALFVIFSVAVSITISDGQALQRSSTRPARPLSLLSTEPAKRSRLVSAAWLSLGV